MSSTRAEINRRQLLLPKLFAIVAFVLAVTCALGAVVIYLPMPVNFLWFAAAMLDELTLWILGIAALGLLFAGASYFAGRRGFFLALAAGLSSVVAVLLGFTTFEDFSLANEQGAVLSLSEYFFGAPNLSKTITEVPGVIFTRNDDRELKLDIYKSRTPGTSPSVIVVHGGSWRRGKRSEYKQFDYWLANEGFTVFDIEYRLADPNCHFPAQVEDLNSAIAWVKLNASRYGGNGARISLLGRSAGAQLVLVAAYTQSENGIVQCVVSYYAPTDLTWDYANPAIPDVIGTRDTLENYLGGSPDTMPRQYAAASPVKLVSSGSVPTLLFQGNHDQVVRAENAELLLAKLRALKVPCVCEYLPGANHGFDWNFNGLHSQLSRAKLLSFLKEYGSSQEASHESIDEFTNLR